MNLNGETSDMVDDFAYLEALERIKELEEKLADMEAHLKDIKEEHRYDMMEAHSRYE